MGGRDLEISPPGGAAFLYFAGSFYWASAGNMLIHVLVSDIEIAAKTCDECDKKTSLPPLILAQVFKCFIAVFLKLYCLKLLSSM